MDEQPARPKFPWMKLLMAIGFVIFASCAVCGVCAVRAMKSAPVQQMMAMSRQMPQLMAEAEHAPGTDELRAKGCTRATVFLSSKLLALRQSVAPERDAGVPLTRVGCEPAQAPMPGCPEIAQTYAQAVGATEFEVIVKGAKTVQPECTGVFRNGEFTPRSLGF